MSIILALVKKEFKQIFRNKGLLPIIFLMPLIQILILGNAADFDVKKVKFAIVNYDKSTISEDLQHKFEHNPRFIFKSNTNHEWNAFKLLEHDEVDVVFIVPENFETDLMNHRTPKIQLIFDAVDGASAGIMLLYCREILADYQSNLPKELDLRFVSIENSLVKERYFFNPYKNYKWYMIPGILVFLVTMIGIFVNAMNIAREKELGTIEQLNVTPLKKHHFIAGKLIPLWIIGLLEMTIGLLIAHFIFGIPVLGSILALYLLTGIYLIIMLSIGLIISSHSDTQQQAMFVAYFLMMIFMFLSGLFTQISSMPYWAQNLTIIIPMSYFIESIRSILLKGADLLDVWKSLFILMSFAGVFLWIAVSQYRKTN
jgi:ABC-2 type transport system permease protein